MRWPLISRRRHEEELAAHAYASDLRVHQTAKQNRDALAAVATELSDLKDEIALHIVAAKHPSSALSDAHSMAISLLEACDARGIDLRIELAHLEGADL